MSTTAMSFMSSSVPLPNLSGDSVESSRQVIKALKCVAFSSMQVSDMIKRKRERVVARLAAMTGEMQLLQADIMENVLNQQQRTGQLDEIEEDLERAQTLGNPELVKSLADELKAVQEEEDKGEVLLRNLKRTVRSRRRLREELLDEKSSVEASMAIFSCKQNLIQSVLATCAHSASVDSQQEDEASSARQSDFASSDMGQSDQSDLDEDLDLAQQANDKYPQMRCAQQPELDDEQCLSVDLSSGSAWSFDSDSQTDSRGRRRSASFRPMEELNEESTNLEARRHFAQDIYGHDAVYRQ